MSHNLGADKSSEIPLHDFEKLKEKKEKDKIQINNSFCNSFENCEISDFFSATYFEFKKNLILKKFNEVHSKIDNFDNINFNSIEKIRISEYLNKSFADNFQLDISSIENQEESEIFDDCEIQLNRLIAFSIKNKYIDSWSTWIIL